MVGKITRLKSNYHFTTKPAKASLTFWVENRPEIEMLTSACADDSEPEQPVSISCSANSICGHYEATVQLPAEFNPQKHSKNVYAFFI